MVRPNSPHAWLAWLMPLVMLLAIVLGAVIVRGQPRVALYVILTVMLLIPVLWVLVSALWPGTADRGCPGCGKDTLVRSDSESTVGLECPSCGWRDETASAWFLAEEEGPLEDIVLRQRGRRPLAKPKPNRSVVDTPGPSD
jgi:hypothetical protein